MASPLQPKGPIANAADVKLDQNPSTLPNVSDALLQWFQPIIFGLITKTVVNFQVKEVAIDTQFFGVWQPANGRELWMRAEGQRQWQGINVWALPAPVQLKIDDVVTFQDKQYRCMSKRNWDEYGYVQYGLLEDYTGSGPDVS